MTTPADWPPEGLDPECKALCEAINLFDGIQTTESCCGHGKQPFAIWIAVDRDNIHKLAPFLYFIDSCHAHGAEDWACKVYTDCAGKRTSIILEGPIGDTAYQEADSLAEQIRDASSKA